MAYLNTQTYYIACYLLSHTQSSHNRRRDSYPCYIVQPTICHHSIFQNEALHFLQAWPPHRGNWKNLCSSMVSRHNRPNLATNSCKSTDLAILILLRKYSPTHCPASLMKLNLSGCSLLVESERIWYVRNISLQHHSSATPLSLHFPGNKGINVGLQAYFKMSLPFPSVLAMTK